MLFLLIFSGFTKAQYNLKDFIVNNTFREKEFNDIIPASDGNYFYRLQDNFIFRISWETGKVVDTILNIENPEIKAIGIPDNFEISRDNKKILFRVNSLSLYRHSFYATYFVYNLEDQKISMIANGLSVRSASLSPDGLKVCYVYQNDLYVEYYYTNRKIRITEDGKEGNIINGAPDWVYEEEFSILKAYDWSTDGNYIAFYRFDESGVKEYPLIVYNDSIYPEVRKIKYPKAGQANPIVQIKVYNFINDKTMKMDIGNDTDIYIPRIKWTLVKGILSVIKMNRLQNKLYILFSDVTDGISKIVYNEKNNRYIDEIPENYPLFINSDNDFLISSEKDGYNHIYLSKDDGNSVKQLTKGKYEIQNIIGFDPVTKTIYYKASEISPTQTEIYSLNINNNNKICLSKSRGSNDAKFSSNFKHFINKYSSCTCPLKVTLCKSDGSLVTGLTDNTELTKKSKEAGVPMKQLFSFKTSEDILLNGWLIKPPEFDSTKKYPVIFYVYGGPGYQTVLDNWSINWLNYLATLGFIVISVDGRGTNGRGEDFRKITYRNFGYYEIVDQLETVKYLSRLAYIDTSRIGVYGWSFGGYLSLMCMMKGEGFFKAAVSVAPVSDWRYYDSVYTERYMGLPSDNDSGYTKSSLLQYADMLKGKLLIIHGSADDNVHVQNTYELSNALIDADKQFETEIYPDRNHSIKGGNTSLQLYTRMTDFFSGTLLQNNKR